MNFQPPDPVCSKCGAETPPCDCDYEGDQMSQAELGLFEQISTHMPLPNWPEVEDICEEFEQRLAEAEKRRDEYQQACAVHADKEKWLESENDRLQKIEIYARAVNSHWNEFGPEHGLDENMHNLHEALTAPQQEQ